jgi:hypothetical protein
VLDKLIDRTDLDITPGTAVSRLSVLHVRIQIMSLDFTLCRSYQFALECRRGVLREPVDQRWNCHRQMFGECVRGVNHHLTRATAWTDDSVLHVRGPIVAADFELDGGDEVRLLQQIKPQLQAYPTLPSLHHR